MHGIRLLVPTIASISISGIRLPSHILTSCDIGFIPLPLSKNIAAYKPENKLVLLLKMALPVICSATPSYLSLLRRYNLEFLACSTSADWSSAYDHLLSLGDSSHRELCLYAQSMVQKDYSDDSITSKWVRAFASL